MRALLLSVLVLTQPSQIVLEGSSNVAVWQCRSTTIEGSTDSLLIPISALRCGNRRMERDMYRALRAQQHPQIEFRFTELRGEGTVEGVLSLAGVTRTITVDVAVEQIAPDRFRLRARLPLRMTDFCITPPTALFGIVKAKNDLTVQFDLVLKARS